MLYKHDSSVCVKFWGINFFLILVFYILGEFLIMKAIPLELVGYELIKANTALQALLAIYHDLISNACLWNNFELFYTRPTQIREWRNSSAMQ